MVKFKCPCGIEWEADFDEFSKKALKEGEAWMKCTNNSPTIRKAIERNKHTAENLELILDKEGCLRTLCEDCLAIAVLLLRQGLSVHSVAELMKHGALKKFVEDWE